MKSIVTMNEEMKELQDNLKQSLVNIIMDEMTVVREVNYVDLDAGEQGLEISYWVADEVILTDE